MSTTDHDAASVHDTTTEHVVGSDHTPGYKFLAGLGKTVLRPGGAKLTAKLLADLDITSTDDVVELAPGMGVTTRQVLASDPATYVGVDRDPAAVDAAPFPSTPTRRFTQGSVSRTGLDDASCDVAFGEAYLTMHPTSQKRRIIAELARIVRPGGRIGLHEVAFRLDDLDPHADSDDVEEVRITSELKSRFKVDFSPLTHPEWRGLLEEAGFEVHTVHRAKLRLLEPQRIIEDEGVAGAARFAANVLRNPVARKRLMTMRSAMRRNAQHLEAFGLTAVLRDR